MSGKKPSYEELRERLAQAEATIESLRRGHGTNGKGQAQPGSPAITASDPEKGRVADEWFNAFNALKDAIWILDADQRVIWSNRAAEKIFDRPADFMAGKHCWEIVHGSARPIPDCPIFRMRHTKQRETRELPLADRWFEVTVDPILDNENRLTGAVHIVADITERKRAEESVREKEALYRTLFENANDAIFLMKDEIFIECNPKTLEIFRCTKDQIIGQPPFLFSPPTQPDGSDSREKALTKIQRVLEGEPQFFEWVHCRLDGSPFYSEVSLNRIQIGESVLIQAIVRDVTERVQAEKALKENRSYLQAVLDSINDAVFIDDADTGQIIDVNLSCCNMYGYSYEEMIRIPIGDLSQGEPPYSQADALQWLDKARREGPQTFDWLAKRKDGSLFWVEVGIRYAIIGGENRFLVVARDITERKRAEEKIKESEETYRNLFHNAQVGLFRTRISDGQVLECNDQLARMFGYENRKEVIDKHDIASDYVDPGTRQKMLERIRRDGYVENFEARFYRKDRSIIWVRYSARLYPDQGWIEGVAEDITKRKQGEEELARLAKAIEQAGEAIVITDPAGTIQYVNPAFTAVTGYEQKEAIGQNPRVLKSGRHDPAFYQDLWETISGGCVWQGTFVNKRKDGTLYTESATISPVMDASGRIVNFVAVKRDISDQLRVEEEKARLQEQLQQSQKLESIGLLAGGVAHDFNNMLSVILGYGEMVLEKLRPEDPLRADVAEMVAAGRKSAALTRQLLAFSRKQTLQPEVVNLNDLVRNLEKMLTRLIGEDIELKMILAPDAAKVYVDPGQIEQVIMNLAVNARDAMPQGGMLLLETSNVELDDVYVAQHTGVKPGKYLLLAVTDTGCGMSKEVMSRLFEPFFTTKEKGRGTGLGLSTVYGIVKQSGGNIWVYSEPGQGTTFKVYLPQSESKVEPQAAKPKQGDVAGKGERILLVEDEESLRKLMANYLSRHGYAVTAAANGGEALLLVEEKGLQPDLIVTDVIMPNMSGKELMDRLKRNHPHLKALYVSGYTDNAIVHHGILDPGTHFIQKPFNMRELGEKIRSLLREKRPERSDP